VEGELAARPGPLAGGRPAPAAPWHVDLGTDAVTAGAVQRAAVAAHASQACARPRAQRHLDRQDDREQLCWLVPPRRMFALG